MNRLNHVRVTAILLSTIFVPSAILAYSALLAMEGEIDARAELLEFRERSSFEDFDTALRDSTRLVEQTLLDRIVQCGDGASLRSLAKDALLLLPFDAAVLVDREGGFLEALVLAPHSRPMPWSVVPRPFVNLVVADSSAGVVSQSDVPPWFEAARSRMEWRLRLRDAFANRQWLGQRWPGEQVLLVYPGRSSSAVGGLLLRLDKKKALDSLVEPSRAAAKPQDRSLGLVPRLPSNLDGNLILGAMLPPPFEGLYTAKLRSPLIEDWAPWQGLVIWTTIAMVATGIFLTMSSVVRGIRLAQLQSDFVSTVSHELRTPLTSIAMFVEMLQMGRYDSDEEKKEYLAILQRETDRLKRLIERVLNFTKLEKGTKRFEFKLENLAEVVVEAIQIFREQNRGTNYELDLTVLQNLSPVLIDRDSMGEVILNLLSNALKYSPEVKKIRVNIRERRREILLEVEDQGIGISRRDRARIFQKFYRADNSLSREVEGTGIGLAICKSIAMAHRGDLTVASRPGKGSRFTLVLPKAPIPKETAAKWSQQSSSDLMRIDDHRL